MTTPTSALPASATRVIEAVRSTLDAVPFSLLQLVMRVGVGAMFLRAGLLKYRSWEVTLLLFRDEYHVPFMPYGLAARMATFNELVFSSLLILGLGTRLATLPFLGMLAVIQTFVYPDAWSDHVLWASVLLTLLFRGAGALSLDHFIWRRQP